MSHRAKKVDAVVFDLDGTLVDSLGLWDGVEQEWVARRKLQPWPDMHRTFGILGFFDCARLAIEHWSLDCDPSTVVCEWAELATAAYADAATIPLRPGTRELLSRLHAARVPMGLATSNWRALAETALQTHGIERYFAALATSDEVPCGKPMPDVYECVARKLGATANEHVLVVEDNHEAAAGAKSVGMLVVAVKEMHKDGEAASWPAFARIADWTVIDSLSELLHDASFVTALGL